MLKQKLYSWLWSQLPEVERRDFVERLIENRARRRAAMAPFPRAFEDEVNNAGVDVYRDHNRQAFQ